MALAPTNAKRTATAQGHGGAGGPGGNPVHDDSGRLPDSFARRVAVIRQVPTQLPLFADDGLPSPFSGHPLAFPPFVLRNMKPFRATFTKKRTPNVARNARSERFSQISPSKGRPVSFDSEICKTCPGAGLAAGSHMLSHEFFSHAYTVCRPFILGTFVGMASFRADSVQRPSPRSSRGR